MGDSKKFRLRRPEMGLGRHGAKFSDSHDESQSQSEAKNKFLYWFMYCESDFDVARFGLMITMRCLCCIFGIRNSFVRSGKQLISILP